MNEYKKRLAPQGPQTNSEPAAPQKASDIPNSVLNDVFAGKRKATNEMMGRRTDPAPSVLAKMSQAFGMDFSGVQVYRSDAMSGTSMHGMAQGNKVVLGSDVDLNTQKGQAVLGHELSHIRAQSMGIGTGSGLLRDAGLEHQADNEGLLAASGQNIYGESMGMTTGLGMAGFEGLTPLSGGLGATAAAPMQASDEKSFNKLLDKKSKNGSLSEKDQAKFDRLSQKMDQYSYKTVIKSANLRNKNDKNDLTYREWETSSGGSGGGQYLKHSITKNKDYDPVKFDAVDKKLKQKGVSYDKSVGGADGFRLLCELCQPEYSDVSVDEIATIYEDYFNGSDEKKKEAQLSIKEIRMRDLEKLEQDFGTLPTQMHTQDLIQQTGLKSFASRLQSGQQIQDVNQGVDNQYNVPFADQKKEDRYNALKDYYGTALPYMLGLYAELESNNKNNVPQFDSNGDNEENDDDIVTVDKDYKNTMGLAKANESKIHGKRMTEKQLAEYNKGIEKRINKKKLKRLPTLD